MPRPVNDAGLDLVRTFEGLRTDAYRCPAGVWTIGYGHTGDVQPARASLPSTKKSCGTIWPPAADRSKI